MLVRIVEYNYDEEYDKLENPHFLAATEIDDYDTFLSMLQNMKGKDIVIGEEWYSFEGDYTLSFPKTDEDLMCLNVFVCGY